MQIAPRAEIDAYAHEQYRKKYREQPESEVRNFGPLLELRDDVLLEFRGRVYRSPPTPYPESIRLYEFSTRLHVLGRIGAGKITRAHLEEVGRIQAAAVDLFWHLCRPIDRRRFLPNTLLPNPFRAASPKEVDDLLGFFWQHRTRSSVRALGRVAGRR